MKLSILMAGLSCRPWQAMWNELSRQRVDGVELLKCIDGGEETSGVKRQRLVDAARGEYVAFVDDDDEISPDYVASILSAIESKPDVVTFRLAWTADGVDRGQWTFGLWGDGGRMPNGTRKMAANHLCAWRRDIAQQVAWCPRLGYGDDQLWYKPLHAAGIAHRAELVDRVLYRYRFVSATTANQTNDRHVAARAYWKMGIRCFRDGDGQILIEDGSQPGEAIVRVRDARNQLYMRSVDDLTHYQTVRLA